MGKATGFLEYERVENPGQEPLERIKTYREFHTPLNPEERQKQGARCMDCGVPFCQNGKPIMGMVSGCPLNNLCPEWNELVYKGRMEDAARRLLLTNCFPEFTSRVCPALCEKACTCGLYGDPVTVKENEYAIIESAYESGFMKPRIPKVRTGRKVAVIGSAPLVWFVVLRVSLWPGLSVGSRPDVPPGPQLHRLRAGGAPRRSADVRYSKYEAGKDRH